MNPTKNKQELTAPPKNELAALGADDIGTMYGDLGADDIAVPRLTVLQGLSPQVSDGLGKPGTLFVTGLNRDLGRELEIVPLLRNRTRMRWRPLDEGGGIICQSFDSKTGVGDPGGDCERCPMAVWRSSKPPLCDVYENVIVALRADEDWVPVALSGARTKLKAMKDLNTLFMAEMLKKRPLFMKSYVIRVIDKMNKAGLKYYNFRVMPGNNNQVLPAAEIEKAQRLYDMIKHRTLNIQQTADDAQHIAPNDEI